jgi:fission process protein 1
MPASSPSSVDSTDTPYRYAAYANRIRTILLSAHRYVAYTSDIGESFRPVAHPILVRSAYAVSWAYLLGDVSHEGYKAYLRNRRALTAPGQEYRDASVSVSQEIRGMATGNLVKPLDEGAAGQESELTPWNTNTISLAEDYRMVMAKRAVFQSLASMGLPAFTIHSVVKYSGKMVRGSKVAFVRTWVPIGVCLGFLAFLRNVLANAFDIVYSSVSLLFPSYRTYSITLLKKPWTGHSVLRYVFMAARMRFVLCLRMR